MGNTFTTVCTRCRVDAPEVGDFGYIGVPSLETKRTKKPPQPFGCLYAGLAALGLLTEEIEAFHAFLQEHDAHPLRRYDDGGDEDFGAGDGEADPALTRTRKFKFKKGRFALAVHELACAACGEVQRGGEPAPLRPFDARTLTAEQAKLFRTNCRDFEGQSERVGGFPFDDLGAIARFLEGHAGHVLRVRLDTAGLSARAKARGGSAPRVAATPPEPYQLPDDTAGLRAALQQETDAVRRSKVVYLLEQRLPHETTDELLQAMSDPEASVRTMAVYNLRQHAKQDPRVVPALIAALADSSVKVAGAAVHSLRMLKASQAVPRIVELLLASESNEPSCLEALFAIGGPEAAAGLGGALAHRSPDVRGSAVHWLKNLKTSAVNEHLVRALADSDDGVALLAARAVGDRKITEAVPALVAAYSRPSESVRSNVVYALGKLGGPEALRVLVTALRDRSKGVRQEAAAGLVKQDDAEGNRALVAAAKRGDAHVARGAWHYLLGEGEPGTDRALADTLEDVEDVYGAHTMAASFMKCGNGFLARKARAYLDGQRPESSAPKIKWGSRRSAPSPTKPGKQKKAARR